MKKQPFVGSVISDRPQVMSTGYYVTGGGKRRLPLRDKAEWKVLLPDGYFTFATFSEAIAKADKLARGAK